MRLPRISFSVITLVISNLVPLAGVFYWGLDAMALLFLYWLENIIIGFYNALKLALVKTEYPAGYVKKAVFIVFFFVHFGGFCFGHVMMLLSIKGACEIEDIIRRSDGYLSVWSNLLEEILKYLPEGRELALAALFISHGISFVTNYLMKKEYAVLTMEKVMTQPYSRIFVMHISIIAGGTLVIWLGSSVPMLCFLILFKIILDVYFHIKGHDIFSQDAGNERTSDNSQHNRQE